MNACNQFSFAMVKGLGQIIIRTPAEAAQLGVGVQIAR